MSTATEQRQQVVSAAIREISHIATLPEITLRIVELVEDPKSTAQDLHKVISKDPALCGRILKVVNSSFYGLPGQIASINRAIVMLGLNAVKNIAIAASLAKLFRGGELTARFSAKDLWTHSTLTAAAAKITSDSLKMGISDEAFLAGLMHDIGLMVEMQYDRSKLIDIMEKMSVDASGAPTADLIALESECFGASHQDFGAGLCEKWKFPRSFAAVTGFHHRPLELPPDQRKLVCIVHIADRLAAETGQGFRLDLPSIEIDPAVRDELKITVDRLDEIRRNFIENSKSVMDLLA
ncbi:MAG: HDOD domain-containing protein [Phycisphaeraceae bacterium]|nr:HDOD domain-containing protein [Phycisphaerae bacterium]MBX3391776.1 HDOD domain-containing protein [Phycisphaeraceae bacterium]